MGKERIVFVRIGSPAVSHLEKKANHRQNEINNSSRPLNLAESNRTHDVACGRSGEDSQVVSGVELLPCGFVQLVAPHRLGRPGWVCGHARPPVYSRLEGAERGGVRWPESCV